MIRLIEGGSHTDQRGTIRFVNEFNMGDIKRFYLISHPNIAIVRAWQGHQEESKYFIVIKGSFLVCGVKIDDFNNPSKSLIAEEFVLKAFEPAVLHIPAGYANGIKALEADSELMVFSNKTIEEAVGDQVRFDSSLWLDWSKY